MTTVQIKNKTLKNFSKPYIIAEACINHEGNLENAFKMIEIQKNLVQIVLNFKFII